MERAEAVGRGGDAYARYVLFILFLGYVVNSIDRSILNILLAPIQQEFTLSDTALGLLGGIAFALFYSTLGLPIAALADRTSRKWVLSVAICLWSGMTALCGLAANFPQLLAARVGTAIGEAGGSPPSHSLIADYFPLAKRGTALSLYALGVPIGGMIGLLIGGWGNELWGWRTAFVVAGLPGILIAALVAFTVREPVRGLSDGAAAVAAAAALPPAPGPFAVLRILWRRAAFRNMALAAALHAFVWYGAGNFNSVFLIRSHGMSTGEAGSWLALLAGFGAAGTFLGGFLSDRLAKARNDDRWYMWVPGIATVLGVPFQIGAYLLSDMGGALVCFGVTAFLASFFFGPSFAMAQALAGVRMRAVAASVLLFIQTMIGLGLGPLIAGMLSDALKPALGIEALRYALILVGLVNLWSGIHYVLAARTVRSDIDRARHG